MNGIALFRFHCTQIIHRLAEHVQHAAQRLAPDRHGDGPARVERLHAAYHALGGLHGDGANAPFAKVLLHFGDDVDRRRHVKAFADDPDRVINFGQVVLLEEHVQHRADDLHHMPHRTYASMFTAWSFPDIICSLGLKNS